VASRSGTIDSIKVGLGIDRAQIERDIEGVRKDLQRSVEITVKLRKPEASTASTWLTSLQGSVDRGKAINVKNITFDKGIAKTDFEAVMRDIQRSVQPIVVPVHFRREADATMPPGSGGIGGTGGFTPPGGPPGRPPRPPRQPSGAAQRESNTAAGAQQASTALSQPTAARPAPAPTVTSTPAPAARSTPARPVATTAAAPVYQTTSATSATTAARGRGQVRQVIGGGNVDAETGELIQSAEAATIRRSRDMATVTREGAQGMRLMHAFQHQDWAAIDAMFPAWRNKAGVARYQGPGVGTALSTGNVGQAREAYLQSFSPSRRKRAGQMLSQMGETSRTNIAEVFAIGGANAARAAERGGPVLGFESLGASGVAQQNPLAFALSALLGGVNMGSRPFLKRMGGIAVADPSGQGRSPGGRRTTASVMRELERTPVPYDAQRIIDKARTTGARLMSSPSATGVEPEALAEALAENEAFLKSQEKLATVSQAAKRARPKRSFTESKSLAELDVIEKERRAVGRAVSKAIAGLPIIYGEEDLEGGPRDFLSAARDIGSTKDQPGASIKYRIQQKIEADLARKRSETGLAMGGLADRLLSAKIQKAYDIGDVATGQRLQLELEQRRGGWTAPATPSSLSMLAAGSPSRKRTDSGMAMGGYEQGARWYRGGTTTQDLFTPGRYYGDPYPKGHPEGGMKWRDEPYATLGTGLYMTDRESADTYAELRSKRGDSRRGLPVVGSRRVDIPENAIWGPSSPGRIGNKWAHDDDLLDQWHSTLWSAREAVAKRMAAQEGLLNLQDYAAQHGYDESLAAIAKARASGDPLHIADAIGHRYAANQTLFTKFMQARGYQGLLAHEGGEYSPSKGGFFAHPSLVVFDPKNKNLHERMGGWARMGMGGSSSLSDLPGIAANAESITEVGEQGPEALVKLRGGGAFVVPNHQLRPFKKMVGMQGGGELGSEWDDLLGRFLRRSGGRGVPPGPEWEDLVREFAGPSPRTPQPRVRRVGTAGLQILGGGTGTWAQRRFRASQEAFEEGRASQPGAFSPGVQRVFVVNWPTGRDAGHLTTTRSGPARPQAAQDAQGAQQGAQGLSVTPVVGPGGPGGRAGTTQYGRQTVEASVARFAARDAVGDFASRLDQVGIDISEALQQSPVRALSVAMGQIAQTVVGGRAGILQRAAFARAAREDAGAALGEQLNAERTRFQAQFEQGAMRERVAQGEVLSPDDMKRFEGFTKTIDEQNKRIDTIRPLIEEQVALAEALSKGGTVRAGLLSRQQRESFGILRRGENETDEAFAQREAAIAQQEVRVPGILSRRQLLTSQAVGLGGIVGGTMLFTLAMNLAQQGIQYLGAVATDAGDKLSGFGFTARRQAQQMAEGFAETPFRRVAEAQTLVRLGATPDQIGGLDAVSRQAQIFAGITRLQEMRDLQRSGLFFGGQRGPIPGLGIGFGNGLFGSFIGQQQGVSELIASALRSPTQARVGAAFSPQGSEIINDPVSEFAQDMFDRALPALQDVVDGGRRVAEMDAAGLSRAEATERRMDIAEQAAIAANFKLADSWNKDIDKWAKFNRELSPGRFTRGTPGVLDEASLRAFQGAGFGDAQLDAFRQAGIGFVGPNGMAPTADLINQALEAISGARLLPSPQQMLETMRPAFEASMQAQARQFQLQRELIPATAAEQLFAQPFPTSLSTGITAPGISMASQGATNRLPAIREARAEMEKIAAAGERTLLDLGVPQQAIDDVKELGAAVTDLQSQADDLQLGLEQAQYNEQIRISVRGIGDLLALTGRQSMAVGGQVIAATELGRLQRAQISDSRELANIQLARSQRELNLQIALSRLRSPGETPEERAVRRREAELLAREQQQELDINRRTTQRGFRIEDIGFGRQLEDAVKQLGLLQQARAVAIEVRGIQRVQEATQQLLAVKSAFLATSREAGVALRQAASQIIETLEARLGRLNAAQIRVINEYVQGISEAWGEKGLIGRILFGSRGEGGGGGGGGRSSMVGLGPTMGQRGRGGTARTGAHADLGLWSQPYVPERTTPLRSDMNGGSGRAMGGGGGGTVNIRVDVKADVRGEADEDRMARKVARMLHDEVALLVNA
jgi:hypothetical protein